MKLTPWYPSSVKPVRVGWYEIRATEDSQTMRYFWNGEEWGNNSYGAWFPSALNMWDWWEWRGLTRRK